MPKGRARFYVWVGAFVVILALGYFGLRPVAKAPRTVGVQVGQIAPDFTLPTLNGGRIHLRALRGHPVMLNFFASWCVPCQEEAPELERVSRVVPGLRLVGVDLYGSEVALKPVQDFVAKFHLTYPLALDANNTVANRYQVAFAPTTFFIDSQGVIQEVQSARLTQGDIRQALERIGARLP